MTYTDKMLEDEITAQIYATGSVDSVQSDWIALAVIRAHMAGDFQKHSDFVANAVWAHTRRITGKVLRDLRPPPSVDGQTMTLPGFELLQSHYEVERVSGNTRTVQRVTRSLLTTAERRALALGLHSMARAFDRHGDELDRETDELIASGMLDDDSDAPPQ